MASGYWAALLSEGDRRLKELESTAQTHTQASSASLHAELQVLLTAKTEAGGEAGPAAPEEGDTPVSLQTLSYQLTQLCTNVNLTDEGGPGAMPDPRLVRLRGMVAAHQQDAAVEEYLQMDVPSMRWGGLSTVGSLSSFAAFDSFLASKSSGNSHQDLRLQLQGWAAKRLGELNRDATASMIHNQLLKAAVRDRTYLRSKPEWWRLSVPRDDLPKAVKLAAGVYHLASSREGAWVSLERCMWHSMALSTRLDVTSQASGQDQWSPFSFESAKVDLEQAHMDMVERVVKQAAATNASADVAQGTAAGTQGAAAKAAKLQEELMAMLSTLTPATYLQMVGQKLLYHAAVQLPVLATLPDAIQPAIIRGLYTLPFARAVSMALEMVCEDPDGLDPTPFAPKAADDMVKKWRVLQSNAAAAGAGEARVEAGAEAKGPTKSGIKTILHVIKGITKDIVDFESGLLFALEQVPEVLRNAAAYQVSATLLQEVTGSWPLRSQSLRSLLHSDMETALLAHRSGLGTLLVTAMTRAVRGMLAGPAKPAPGQADGSAMPAEDVNSDLWPKLEEVMELPGTVASLVPGDDHFNDQQPKYIDPTSHQVLNFLAGTIHRMANFPDLVQALLTVAVLECFSLLLDQLASSCAPAHGIGQGLGQTLPFTPHHAPRMLLLHHGAAACARRLLLAFRGPLQLPLFDDYYEAMVKGYANTLLQAEELVSALSQQIVRVHSFTANALVLPAIDGVKWDGVRRPLKRARAASAAPRTWRCCLCRLLHGLVQLSTPAFASWVIGQVLQEGLAAASLRYEQLAPSPQLLPHFVADVLHLTCTAYMFTLQRSLPTMTDLLASSKSPSRSVSKNLSGARPGTTDAAASAAAAALDGRPQFQVAEAVARAASDMCLALCTRAALLTCPPAEMEQAMQGSQPCESELQRTGSRSLRPQLPAMSSLLRTSPTEPSAPPPKAKLPSLPGRTSADGSATGTLTAPLPPLAVPARQISEGGSHAGGGSGPRGLGAPSGPRPRKQQSASGAPSSGASSETPGSARGPQQPPTPAATVPGPVALSSAVDSRPAVTGHQHPVQGPRPIAESTESGPEVERRQGEGPVRSQREQPPGQPQEQAGVSRSRLGGAQPQVPQQQQRRQVVAASSASASLTNPLLLSGGASRTAIGCEGDGSVPWSWLPQEVRSALRRSADGLVTDEELVRGFNPLNHMDVSTEEFLTIQLAVDKAEEEAAAKAMAAIGRERTLKRQEKSMAAGAGAPVAGGEGEALASETPAGQTPSSRAPSRTSSRAASWHVTTGRAGGSAAVAESLVAAAWADLLSRLVEQAPQAAMLSALTLRHELQPQVPGLPYSELELQERAHIHKLTQGGLTQRVADLSTGGA